MKRVKELMKKWKSQLIMLCIIIVLVIMSFLTIRQVILLKKELSDLKKQEMKVDTIREELQAISEYSAYQFNYTSILDFSDNIEWGRVKVPFTNTEYIATIDGYMKIGIDAKKADINEKTNGDGVVEEVVIKIPHSEILENATISDSLKEYDYDKNVFNPIEPGEHNQLRVKAEEKEKKKVESSDILSKSDKRIENLLETHFQSIYGKDVKIKIEYIEQK